MNKLEKLHKEIQKENRRIEMMKNTISLDVDFMRSEVKKAKNKIVDLQMKFDKEYNLNIIKNNIIMKNILGTTEDLTFYNKEGVLVYEFYAFSDDYSFEYTFDENGEQLTYKNSSGVKRGFEIPFEFTIEGLTQN